ncbi:hypothetical protein KQI84_15485 [bacterium]|nr:hypothetical protein [bacterium]
MGKKSAPESADVQKLFRIGVLVSAREALSPELWRISDIKGRIAELSPVSLGTTHRQAPLNDLRRYRIKTTDQVFRDEDLVEVVGIRNPRSNDLYEYEVMHDGQKVVVREHELMVHVGSRAVDPLDLMRNLDAAPAAMADARVEMLASYFRATARSLGIGGYTGARMLPIPHQISAARYALLFGRPRFLLADEVGLGKTVEAGLIIHTLQKYFPNWYTAIFVPESLTVQWAFEMYGKFGKTIYRLSEDDQFDDGWEDEFDDPGMILSHAEASRYGKRRKPELLVVDEAHQVLRDEKQYKALLEMSRHAHAVLLLTATPTSDDGQNLVKLLRLVDPQHFEKFDPKSLMALFEKQGSIESLLRQLRDPASEGNELVESWKSLGIPDEDLDRMFGTLLEENEEHQHERYELASALTDRFYPGSRILRYQRKFLAIDNEMAERVEEPLEYKATMEEKAVRKAVRHFLDLVRDAKKSGTSEWQDIAAVLVQASHSSPLAVDQWIQARRGELEPQSGVSADPIRRNLAKLQDTEPLEGEEDAVATLDKANQRWQRASRSVDMKGRALARMPRYMELVQQVQGFVGGGEPSRVLIFTSFECNVRPLYLLLKKALGDDVEVFYLSAELEWRDREKSAFAFQEHDGPCVLVSDDLGGEGRNFQFADALFHFDLPLAAWILEQRIGRLDRVGRDETLDVDSQILYAIDELDQAIYEFQRDGVSVFNDSLAPIEDLIDNITRRMITAMIDEGTDGIADLVDEVAEQVDERREREASELITRRDRGVEDVRKLVPLLDDTTELTGLRRASVKYARLLGSMVDESGDCTTITVGAHHPLHAMPGVLSEMQGHFQRHDAVRHERREFFSAGHPFVRALARGALEDSGDRAAFILRGGIDQSIFHFWFRMHLPPEFLESVRALPEDVQPSLLCAAAGSFGTRMLRFSMDMEGNLVEPTEDNAELFRPFGKDDLSLDEGQQIYEYLPKDWADCCTSCYAKAEELAAKAAEDLRLDHIDAFEDVLCEVLTRHFGVDHPLEAQIDSVLFVLEDLVVELDSVLAVFPSETT